MLKIEYQAGLKRNIKVFANPVGDLYPLTVEISSNNLKLSLKLSLAESMAFFSNGLKLAQTALNNKDLPIK